MQTVKVLMTAAAAVGRVGFLSMVLLVLGACSSLAVLDPVSLDTGPADSSGGDTGSVVGAVLSRKYAATTPIASRTAEVSMVRGVEDMGIRASALRGRGGGRCGD